MTRERTVRILFFVAKAAVIAAGFAYIAVTIARNVEDLKTQSFTLRPWPLIASFPLAVAYLLGRATIWHLLVRRTIGQFPLHVDVLSWLGSLVGKYVPGKVFLLFGRVYLYRDSGVSAGQVSFCFLIEMCCSTLATLVIFGTAVLWQQSPHLELLEVAMAGIAALLLFVSHPEVLRFIVNTTLRIAQRPAFQFRLRWRDVLGVTLVMSANWLILGAGFYLLLQAIIEISPRLYLFVTGAFAVAGLVGVLALFAPSGIGVREGVMTFVLSTVLPPGVAAIAAILARVWTTLAEALCCGVALLVVRATRPQSFASDGAGDRQR